MPWLAAASCLTAALPARAQAPAPAEADPPGLAAAKEQFREGVALIASGDYEAALDRFQRSRAAFPSGRNTLNAALCLDRLGRYDEALELYEEVAARFATELKESDKAALGPAMTVLRTRVASLEISANVEGSVVVDGRARGRLPRERPVRVLPGPHRVRVLRDGYATAERQVEVALGATLKVDLALKPLEAAGQLRIEDSDNAGSQVFIDRVDVGTSPWEGTLGPGKHVVWTRGGGRGSPPVEAVVVQGQTAVLRVRSGVLGPTTRLQVVPATSELSIDGVTLGAGTWEGQLPVGPHAAVAAEPGYFPDTARFRVDEHKASTLSLRPRVDPDHPRWPKPVGRFWVGAWGGPAIGSSFAGGAEASCPKSCTGSTLVVGGAVAGRGGFRFRMGLSLELEGGYLALQSSFSRALTQTSVSKIDGKPLTVAYGIDDAVRVAGPFAAGGASQEIALGSRVTAVGRLSVGAFFASSADRVHATAAGGGDQQPAELANGGASAASVALLVVPEIAANTRIGPIQAGLGLALAVLPLQGPKLPQGALTVSTPCVRAHPTPPTCAQDLGTLAGERAYGVQLLWLPRVTASYGF